MQFRTFGFRRDGRRMIIKLIGADETIHFLPTERVRGYKTK